MRVRLTVSGSIASFAYGGPGSSQVQRRPTIAGFRRTPADPVTGINRSRSTDRNRSRHTFGLRAPFFTMGAVLLPMAVVAIPVITTRAIDALHTHPS